MKHITSRVYENESDFQIILDLIARVRLPEHPNEYPMKVDIEENLASAGVRANTRLWFDDEQPLGWADVDEFNNLRWEIEKQYKERIGKEIVEWGESCIRKTQMGKVSASTDPVATHPRYQRMGLARALLARGMQLLKERGMLSAHLGTSGDNIAMQKTAGSVGFTVGYKTIWFSKEVY